MTCSGCGNSMDAGARFCSACGRAFPAEAAAPPYAAPRPGLVRPRYGRVIAGVCQGFAQHYGWDVTIVRIILVAAVFFGAGSPVLAYLIAWIVMPNEQYSLPSQTGVQPQ
jgi:phage shock protein C